MSPDSTALTAADLEFLARPLHGFLTVAASPVPAQPRPVWFEATTEGTVQLFTGPTTPKVRRLREDPRASIIVASPAGEPEHWVAVTGRVTLESDGAQELAARLAARYWDLDEPANKAAVEQMMTDEQVRIVIQADRVKRFQTP